jgi:uncharacterized membrane protein YfcA
MSGGDRTRAALAGFAAGLAGGLFGVGGGILLVPILTNYFSLTQHEAHGTSLAAIGATAAAGLVVYALHGNVAWTTAALMAVTSIIGAKLGARAASATSRRNLTLAFAAYLAIVAVRLLLSAPAAATGPPLAGWAGIALDLAIGLAVGLLSGFLGVGGGVIVVPALTMLMGFSQQAAQGTSLAVILVTAPFGAMEHSRKGNVAWRLVPMLSVGAIIGAPIASLFAQRLPQTTLVFVFALFLLANSAVMAFKVLRQTAPATPDR